jgi:uncharacterized delta-60 repeat protein
MRNSYFLFIFMLIAGSLHAQSEGEFDDSFNGNGWVIENIHPVETFYDEVVQPDGKIIAAGSGGGNQDQPYLIRYNVNGSRDNSFGTNGLVNLMFDATGIYETSIALNASGQIYVTSSRRDASGPIYLARLNSNGTPDNTFGTNGMITDSVATGTDWEHVYAITLQADGKMLITGYVDENSSGSLYDLWVIRYNTNGTRDASFGTGGLVRVNSLSASNNATPQSADISDPNRILVQPDGKILIGGKFKSITQLTDDFLLIRLNSDGSMDHTFGQYGVLFLGMQYTEEVTGMALQSDGSIIIGGPCGNGYTRFRIVKITPGGTGDASFGTATTSAPNIWGYTAIDLYQYIDQSITDLQVLLDDRIVASGNFGVNHLCVFRFKADGTPDSTFSLEGRADSSMMQNSQSSYRIKFDAFTGRLYVVGWVYDSNLAESYSYITAIYNGSATGIDEAETNPINVYPNPADDKVFITGITGKADVEVFSVDGQLMWKGQCNNNHAIPVEGWSSGLYIMRVRSEEQLFVKKIMVE